jgi:peptidoglycan glycosyltransferase
VIARRRRNTELVLILLAAVVTMGAYALGALGRTSSLPAHIVPWMIVVLGLLLVAHIATRLLAPGADCVLLPVAAFLNGLGYAVIARLNSNLAGLQATWTLLGVGAYVATLAIVRRPNDLARYKWTFALLGIVLLLLPLAPGLGRTINGSRIWIHLGTTSFQPGEFAKIVLALFFAAYIVERRELLSMATWHVGPLWLPEPRHLGPLLLAFAATVGIMVMQRDLGSALLFFSLFVVMVWVATERASYLAMGAVLFAVGAWMAWQTNDTVQLRVRVWLNPWKYYAKDGYQLAQGQFGMAWGGITGTGIGLGDPTRIPLAQNDFIFAAIGEELGLLGATAVLIAFLLLIGSGLRIAVRIDRPFEKLLAVGLTTILGVQAFIIVAGVTRVTPLTGVTLPFVSYGGSSLLANWVLLGLLMRLSDDAARRLGEVPERRRRRRGPDVNEMSLDPTTALRTAP